MSAPDLDDVRTRLAVAAADASKAHEEASQVARVVITTSSAASSPMPVS